MTAAEFADLVEARRSGAGKWQRVARHMQTVCRVSAFVKGLMAEFCFIASRVAPWPRFWPRLRLDRRDLHSGPRRSPEQAAALRAEREACERNARLQREGGGTPGIVRGNGSQ